MQPFTQKAVNIMKRIPEGKGTISLPRSGGYEEQEALLLSEGVRFDEKDRIDLKKHLWTGA